MGVAVGRGACEGCECGWGRGDVSCCCCCCCNTSKIEGSMGSVGTASYCLRVACRACRVSTSTGRPWFCHCCCCCNTCVIKGSAGSAGMASSYLWVAMAQQEHFLQACLYVCSRKHLPASGVQGVAGRSLAHEIRGGTSSRGQRVMMTMGCTAVVS